jgi:uncharacterized protein (TIGR02996 family)
MASEEDGFLNALYADGHDEVTRSIYADWLDERGDERGAYLRAEMAVHALGYKAPRGAAARLKAQETITKYHALRGGLNRDWLARVARPDWILVEGAKGKAIDKVLADTAQMWDSKPRSEHEVFVHRLRGGRHALRAVPVFAPYFLCDLLGWVADPEYNEGVMRACAWMTSPHTGVRYFFVVPDPEVSSEFVPGYAPGGREVVFNRATYNLSSSSRKYVPHVAEPRWTPAKAPQVAVRHVIAQPDATPKYPAFRELSDPV